MTGWNAARGGGAGLAIYFDDNFANIRRLGGEGFRLRFPDLSPGRWNLITF